MVESSQDNVTSETEQAASPKRLLILIQSFWSWLVPKVLSALVILFIVGLALAARPRII